MGSSDVNVFGVENTEVVPNVLSDATEMLNEKTEGNVKEGEKDWIKSLSNVCLTFVTIQSCSEEMNYHQSQLRKCFFSIELI